ncbi:MAG: Hsp70 family protein [Gammaproteobacteria bacterium]|nr:Hsp70 family protein [Pseudomonadales bacterium]MCP5331684.1 Hsp70 family protein [Pseudomonadales bacterium]
MPGQHSQPDLFDAPAASPVPRRIGIGVDFGTSNSAVAIFDGERIELVRLEQDSVTMPTASYIDRQFQVCTGQQAIDRYIADNMGRKVELGVEVLGEGRSSTGQIGEHGLPEKAETHLVYGQAFVDSGEKGRLFRGVKRLLGQVDVPRLMVFEKAFRLVALIAPILVRIRVAVQQALAVRGPQWQADHACIGHPVNFEGRDEKHNEVALERLSEACQHAGFVKRQFYPEPLAAALSYLHASPHSRAKTLLAVDFGGGTLDLCVLKRDGVSFEVVAIHGIGLGGDHIDQTLFRELLFPLLGKGETWRRKGEDREIETLFPFEDYEELILNWAVSYMLNQNQYTTPVQQCMEQPGEVGLKFRRLYELIKQNYSYLVFQGIKDMKAALSEQEEAVLDIPEIDVRLTLSRARFEALIAGHLQQFRRAVEDTLSRAVMAPEQIDVVVSTGGSSLIPAVRRMLEAMCPGRVEAHDPFTSVAAGLAIAEYEGRGLSDSRV